MYEGEIVGELTPFGKQRHDGRIADIIQRRHHEEQPDLEEDRRCTAVAVKAAVHDAAQHDSRKRDSRKKDKRRKRQGVVDDKRTHVTGDCLTEPPAAVDTGKRTAENTTDDPRQHSQNSQRDILDAQRPFVHQHANPSPVFYIQIIP